MHEIQEGPRRNTRLRADSCRTADSLDGRGVPMAYGRGAGILAAWARTAYLSGMDFGVRVAAVVEQGGALLLVRHQKPDRDPYWVLPGGRLEPGETIPECAGRELAEETGLDASFLGVLYVSEFLREGRHTIDVVVRMALEGDAGSRPWERPRGRAGKRANLEGGALGRRRWAAGDRASARLRKERGS